MTKSTRNRVLTLAFTLYGGYIAWLPMPYLADEVEWHGSTGIEFWFPLGLAALLVACIAGMFWLLSPFGMLWDGASYSNSSGSSDDFSTDMVQAMTNGMLGLPSTRSSSGAIVGNMLGQQMRNNFKPPGTL